MTHSLSLFPARSSWISLHITRHHLNTKHQPMHTPYRSLVERGFWACAQQLDTGYRSQLDLCSLAVASVLVTPSDRILTQVNWRDNKKIWYLQMKLCHYRKTPFISTYIFSGLATVQLLIFGGRTYFRGVWWGGVKNPATKKSLQSCAFRRKHAVVHVSAIMHILSGYRGTHIWEVCT